MAGVRDLMRRVDARIHRSKIVRAVAYFGTSQIPGVFFDKPREVAMPGGAIMGIGISFECTYDEDIATLALNDQVVVDDYGSFRFLRELQPGGDESGKTIIELGEVI
jgi:hypothetical protein